VIRREAPGISVAVRPPGKNAKLIPLVDQVVGLTFTDDEKKADKLKLTIDNFDLSNSDSSLIRQGVVLDVSWGYPGDMSEPRQCVVKKVKGMMRLEVEAFAKSVLMHRQIQNRVWTDKKRSDVVKEIAKNNGFGDAELLHVQDTEVVLPSISQVRTTDAQFIRSLANREGFEFFVDTDGLHFHERKLGQKPLRSFTYYSDGAGDVIGSPEIEETSHGIRGAVKSKARDPIEKKTNEATVDNDSDGTRSVISELVGVPGLGLVTQTSSAPDQPVSPPAPAGSNDQGELDGLVAPFAGNVGTSETLPSSATSAASVKREARGRYRRSQTNTIKLTFTAIGDPRMRAKTVFEFNGIGKTLSGLYYATSVEHALSSSSYTMKVVARKTGRNSLGVAGAGLNVKGKQNVQSAPKEGDQGQPILVPGPGGVGLVVDTTGRGQ